MNPKLRPVETRWVQHQDRAYLMLRDPLALSDKNLLVPRPLAMLLALCDGTRDMPALRVSFELRTGLSVTPQQIEQILGQLDEALLLFSPRFQAAQANAREAFRAAPFRTPALAGLGYPADTAALGELFDGWCSAAEPLIDRSDGAVGLISPHIDYNRGAAVYAQGWLAAANALQSAEIAIVLGTDHAGGAGSLTPTRQHYATPWGVLPTATDVVDELATAIGEDEAYASELNHRREHSIELAVVWLHYLRQDNPCAIVPMLCGSFEHFVAGHAEPKEDRRLEAGIEVLRQVCARHRTIVIAAADLAHVGPVFGDANQFGAAERAGLETKDREMLAVASDGDAQQFLDVVRQDGDARRVCGIPPIYLMLRLITGATGKLLAYEQCPADQEGGSWVSIGSVLYRER